MIGRRYAECGPDYLKEVIVQRHYEVLGNITDMNRLMALATEAHPDLRRLAVIRFQQKLAEALEIYGQKQPAQMVCPSVASASRNAELSAGGFLPRSLRKGPGRS